MGHRGPIRLLIAVIVVGLMLCGAGSVSAQTGTTATGASRAMNPALSVNGLFLGTWQERSPEEAAMVSARLQELEIAYMSMVDPYFKASVFTAMEIPEPDAAGGEHHGVELHLEEAFVRALSLPSGLGARAGKMLMPFGRANQLHTHHLPFVQEQNGFATTIGEEGVSDIGVEVSYAPTVPWYLNLVFFASDGSADLFDPLSREFAYTGRVENLWDLGEATTFELGGSVMTGPVSEDARRNLYGADARIKWKDPRKTYGGALEYLSELIVDSPPEGDEHTVLDSRIRYRFARCWWVGFGHSFLRTQHNGLDAEEQQAMPVEYVTSEEGSQTGKYSDNTYEYKGQIAFTPSEFSMIRLDASYLDRPDADGVFKVELQLNFTIGSHPAHIY